MQIFRLFVLRSPWDITTNKPQKFGTRLGKPVGLTCSAKGNPKPKITWKRKDNKRFRIIDKKTAPYKLGKTIITYNTLQPSYKLCQCACIIPFTYLFFSAFQKHGETIKLYNVRKEDAGPIMCIANNTISPIIMRELQLVVTCKYFSIPLPP